jgi:hypothetical protein
MHFHLHSYNDLEDIPIKRLVDFDMLRRLKRYENASHHPVFIQSYESNIISVQVAK